MIAVFTVRSELLIWREFGANKRRNGRGESSERQAPIDRSVVARRRRRARPSRPTPVLPSRGGPAVDPLPTPLLCRQTLQLSPANLPAGDGHVGAGGAHARAANTRRADGAVAMGREVSAKGDVSPRLAPNARKECWQPAATVAIHSRAQRPLGPEPCRRASSARELDGTLRRVGGEWRLAAPAV